MNSQVDGSGQFSAEITAINLTRIRWLQIVSLVATVVFLAWTVSDTTLSRANIFNHALFDMIATAIMLLATCLALRQPPSSRWRTANVWFALFVLMAGLGSWFLMSLSSFGQTPNYVIALFIASSLVLVPPRHFGWFLAANHIIYCTLLFALHPPAPVLTAALSDGTLGVVIAALVSRLLYRGKLADFQQRQLILAKNAELEEIMMIAAHDLRSPLLGVRNMLDLARQKLADTQFLDRLLEHTSKTCTELETLIARIIDAHAAEYHGSQQMLLAREDLRPLIEDCVARHRSLAKAKEIGIVVEAPESPAVALISPEALSQVLDNLLANAIKYSPLGKQIGIKLFSVANALVVEIWDEGPGIPSEETGDLFKKFRRGSARPTAGESSTGLGLFIVKTLMDRMNGRVTYLSRVPEGACFQLELRT